MRYFVIADDGSRYGPADLGLLQVWANEGRVRPDHFLSPETGGVDQPASTLQGLTFPPVSGAYNPYATAGSQPYIQNRPYSQQMPYTQGYQAPQPLYSPSAYRPSTELNLAWICAGLAGVLELLCQMGFPLALIGALVSIVALSKGQRASGPLAVCIIVLIVAALIRFAVM